MRASELGVADPIGALRAGARSSNTLRIDAGLARWSRGARLAHALRWASATLEALMTTSRGMSLLPIPLALAAVAGLAIGMGGYAFQYAKGSSYLGNDPATCANCHVMAGHYAGWQAAPHHLVATCNDCHTPAGPIGKYVVKALNGYHHSMAFTVGGYPDVIRARPQSTAVVEANCRRCHADLVDGIDHGGGVSCIRCHASVGHLR